MLTYSPCLACSTIPAFCSILYAHTHGRFSFYRRCASKDPTPLPFPRPGGPAGNSPPLSGIQICHTTSVVHHRHPTLDQLGHSHSLPYICGFAGTKSPPLLATLCTPPQARCEALLPGILAMFTSLFNCAASSASVSPGASAPVAWGHIVC